MALIACKECKGSVSTEAVACPHCGALQQRPSPPVLQSQSTEDTIYSDNTVAVTGTRVVIWGTTYPLRNITSVSTKHTPPQIVGAIVLLVIGVFILLAAFLSLHGNAPAPIGIYIIAPAMICGAILWMSSAKTKYHVHLSTASGEIHAVTSKNKAYIEQIVLSINEAIARTSR